jgi:hypothetical protein
MDSRLDLVFGSNGHKYEVFPPVDEARLQGFEAANGVPIPCEYRSFLAAFGGGGAGPDYGIYNFIKLETVSVRERFSLTESRAWPKEDDDPLWRLPGLLTISTSGCAIDWFIEINGPQPGTMWVNAGPCVELMRCDSFGTWYGSWLDRVELGLQKYEVLRTLVSRRASVQNVKDALAVEPHDFEREGVRYLRFRGVPGQVRHDGQTTLALEVGPCWIE